MIGDIYLLCTQGPKVDELGDERIGLIGVIARLAHEGLCAARGTRRGIHGSRSSAGDHDFECRAALFEHSSHVFPLVGSPGSPEVRDQDDGGKDEIDDGGTQSNERLICRGIGSRHPSAWTIIGGAISDSGVIFRETGHDGNDRNGARRKIN